MRSQKIEIKAIDVMLMFGCFCSTHEAIHFLRDYSFQPPVVSYPFGKKEARVIITTSVQHVQVVHMDYDNNYNNNNNTSKTDVAPWCYKWDWDGWISGQDEE